MTGESERTHTTRLGRVTEQRPLRLLVIADGKVEEHALPARGTVTIGRSRSSAVRIHHESISREHAVITIDDGLTIEDRGSRNGVFVRGQRVPEGTPTAIAPAELFEIGEVAATVQRDHRSARSAGADPSPDVVVRAPAMRAVHELVRRAAPADATVLVVGETGTGKEVIAGEIHRLSPRAGKPYLRVNCAAIAESLLESELFGHEKGAFTGAVTARPGLFEAAQGGTILLDEIGEIPLAMQAKLLRVIEHRKVTRVGSVEERAFDARFVAATHRDLRKAIAAGQFREDLYFRLAAITIALPPLRERPEEIEELASRFAAEAWTRAGRPGTPAIAEAAHDRLRRHAWPGNVRELRNVVERGVLLGDGPRIEARDLSFDQEAPPPAGVELPLREEGRALERRRILEALERCDGNQSAAAKLLGMPRRTLVSRLDEYGVARPRKR